MEFNGVYKIECENSPRSYIGQTGHTFKTRFKEHTKKHKNNEVRKEGPSSSFSNHLLDTGHSSEIENLKILHVG
jgi:predicted GIY-YIG superfamily endonuclease